MLLTLDKLLAESALGLELVAGAGGIETRGPIDWIHSSELPNPALWLQKNCILLTTGFGVRGSDEMQRRLIASLDECGCVGVGLGLGDWLSGVPEVMLTEADRRALPLFLVPYTVPFSVVTRRVAELILQEDQITLKESVGSYRRILALVFSDKKPQAVMDLVLRQLEGCGGVLFSFFGKTIAKAGPLPMPMSALWDALRENKQRDRSSIETEGVSIMASPVRIDHEVEAFLVLTNSQPFNDNETLVFEQLLTGMHVALARGHSSRVMRRQLVGEVILDTVKQGLSHEIVERRLLRTGASVEGHFRVLALRPGARSRTSLHALGSLVEDVLSENREVPIVGTYSGLLFCVVSDKGGISESVAHAINRRGWTDIRIGRSRQRSGMHGLALSVREAIVASAHASDGSVTDVTRVGLEGILPQIAEDGWAAYFVQQVLGSLIEADRRDNSELIPTLESYLTSGGRTGTAAAALNVHRHTLAYRLERISSLTGRDPRDGQSMLEFGLALKLMDFIDGAAEAFESR